MLISHVGPLASHAHQRGVLARIARGQSEGAQLAMGGGTAAGFGTVSRLGGTYGGIFSPSQDFTKRS